ncbi:MAG: protein-L-isoaspartate O-methyltransferase [Gammaproteobacteria bacterium]|nr:protein-L-isoaspartate O-methyltransferase [Gammaproteobacteria bacterium]
MKLIETLKKQGIANKKIIAAIVNTPRHLFVESVLKNRAYENKPLPIGYNQTISQPYIVAKMSQVILEEENMDRVLEIGTGSGYQAAVLSNFFKKVYTIERIKPLYNKTSQLLKNMNYKNIECFFGDGFEGLNLYAPFDAIMITASPSSIPEILIKQLKPSGRIIMPLNDKGKQKLLRIKKNKSGLLKKIIDDVFFVPMLEGTQS